MPRAYSLSAVGVFIARSKSSRIGRIARTLSEWANSSTSDFSRSARLRKLSNSAWRRRRSSTNSFFSSSNRSRSAVTVSSSEALAPPLAGGSAAPFPLSVTLSPVSTVGSFISILLFYSFAGFQVCRADGGRKLNRQASECLSYMIHGGHGLSVVHSHGTEHGNPGREAPRKRN